MYLAESGLGRAVKALFRETTSGKANSKAVLGWVLVVRESVGRKY